MNSGASEGRAVLNNLIHQYLKRIQKGERKETHETTTFDIQWKSMNKWV